MQRHSLASEVASIKARKEKIDLNDDEEDIW